VGFEGPERSKDAVRACQRVSEAAESAELFVMRNIVEICLSSIEVI
jgi:hypothetical protein